MKGALVSQTLRFHVRKSCTAIFGPLPTFLLNCSTSFDFSTFRLFVFRVTFRLFGIFRFSGHFSTFRDFFDFSGLFGTFRDFSGLFGTFRDFSGLFGTFRDFSTFRFSGHFSSFRLFAFFGDSPPVPAHSRSRSQPAAARGPKASKTV